MPTPFTSASLPDAPENTSPSDPPRADKAPLKKDILASRWFVLALAIAAVIGTYGHVIQFQFVYDDEGQITKNRLIHSWEHTPRYFTEHVWSYTMPGVPGNYYRPLFLLWLRANHSLFGLDPAGWHATTLLVHLCATLLVYFLAGRLLSHRFHAFAAALLFGLHPVHIESVAWVSGVTDPLLTCLLLSAILCYLYAREARSQDTSWYLSALAFTVAALLTKETAVILPFLLLAHEWALPATQPEPSSWFRRARNLLVPVLPFAIVTAVFLFLRAAVLGGWGNRLSNIPLATTLLTWPKALWFYFSHLAWPFRLSAFYDLSLVERPSAGGFFLPLAGVLCIAAGLLAWARKSRPAAVFAVWMMLPLLPLLNFSLFPPGELVHDRYLYVPSVGYCFLLVLAMSKIRAPRLAAFGQPAAQTALLLVLAAVFAYGTTAQLGPWATNRSLYTHSLTIAPENVLATNNLANLLVDEEKYEQAIPMYERVLKRDPAFWRAYANLGYAYYKMNRLDDAMKFFDVALRLTTSDADLFVRRGMARLRLGQIAGAEADFRRAVALQPEEPGFHLALGLVLRMQGRLTEALDAFQTELLNNPQQGVAQMLIDQVEAEMRAKKSGAAKPRTPSAR
jgi:tetratricopeptide (TPR) repeat protein